MRRTAIMAMSAIASIALLAFSGCQPAAPETNRNAPAAVAEPTKEPFNPAAIEADIMKLEREWASVLTSRDVAALRRIEADDIVLTYPDGMVGTKADDIRDIETDAVAAESYEIAEAKVKVLDADAAIVTGRSIMKKGVYKRAGQRPMDISGEYRFTDVFARRNGNWQVVASQATKIVNPSAATSPAAKASPSNTASPRSSPTTSRTP